MNLAPIALFVYNRLGHTQKTIEALQKNELARQSDLIIFSDGSKNNQDAQKVNAVRNFLQNMDGFRSVQLVVREKNFGLAKSIITGVTEITGKYGKVIVLEDDLITSPYFLKYMNDALEKYEYDDKVISIHGYVYPVKQELPETFFLRGADCWGWATWKRGWDLFEVDSKKLFSQIKDEKLEYAFDIDGSYPFSQMLKMQIYGLNNSWAIRWRASAFLADKLTLYPGHSLVSNRGFDQSGTHGGFTEIFVTRYCVGSILLKDIDIKESKEVEQIIKAFFHSYKVWIIVKLISIRNQVRLFVVKSKIILNLWQR